jgi:phosphoglycerate kinase
MANTFLLAEGVSIGRSLAEPDLAGTARGIMKAAADAGRTIILPSDAVVAGALRAGMPASTVAVRSVPDREMILDIGPGTLAAILETIDEAATVVWNGPVGAFETPPFDTATLAIARHVALRTREGRLVSVAGGGDTIAALNAAGIAEELTFVSTAGGAFLEWMEGKPLPGVEALTADAAPA